jgi:protoheme IX farnesyltransferase
VLFTVAAGGFIARPGSFELVELAHAILGAALVAAGASALNQWLERSTDALMHRTENRPLPSGRLGNVEVIAFGGTLAALGLGYMLAMMASPIAALVTAITLIGYVFVYTPLKSRTTLNTLIGAVPGALPPVIGWTAATGTLDVGALLLFLIVFLWQVPHFLAIAWIYREDYARAGLKMLPALDENGAVTGRQMLLYTLALVPISFVPVLLGEGSLMYGFGALGVGTYFLKTVWSFAGDRSDAQARRVVLASLIYLPVVLLLLLADRWMRALVATS